MNDGMNRTVGAVTYRKRKYIVLIFTASYATFSRIVALDLRLALVEKRLEFPP